MKLGDVRRIHSALAHTLLNVWPICPLAQQVVQSELEGWSLRSRDTADKYLRLIIGRLRSGGVEQSVSDVLGGVQNELQSIDGYLNSMFDMTVARVRDCYQSWADWTVPTVRLEVSAARNPIYPDHASFGELGAVACVPPRKGTDPAVVKLTFVPSLLGPPSWASVPYLLCHELVCHANQAAPMDSEDPFAEGWMDLVAKRLHDHWIEEIFPWAPALARDAANRLYYLIEQRWPRMPEPHMTTRAARKVGRVAATWVEKKLQPFQDVQEPVPALVRLSLQLNRASPTFAGRVAFIGKVNNAGISDHELQAKLLAELRRWLEGHSSADNILSFE